MVVKARKCGLFPFDPPLNQDDFDHGDTPWFPPNALGNESRDLGGEPIELPSGCLLTLVPDTPVAAMVKPFEEQPRGFHMSALGSPACFFREMRWQALSAQASRATAPCVQTCCWWGPEGSVRLLHGAGVLRFPSGEVSITFRGSWKGAYRETRRAAWMCSSEPQKTVGSTCLIPSKSVQSRQAAHNKVARRYPPPQGGGTGLRGCKRTPKDCKASHWSKLVLACGWPSPGLHSESTPVQWHLLSALVWVPVDVLNCKCWSVCLCVCLSGCLCYLPLLCVCCVCCAFAMLRFALSSPLFLLVCYALCLHLPF